VSTLDLGLFLLAAAALLLEIALTRIFAITQFYHFAFMTVSVALLGYGVSGTVLSLAPRWRLPPAARRLAVTALLFAGATLGGYLLANWLPFDSYTIAWERRQVAFLMLYFLSLTGPFFCAGLGTALALAASPTRAHRAYGANLLGSAAGGIAAPLVLGVLGGPGAVMVAAGIGGLAAMGFGWHHRLLRWVGLVTGLIMLILAWQQPTWLALRLSPYKGLSQILNFPDARVVFHAENAQARVEVVESSAIRSLPGLSYTYRGAIPPQRGLLIDGDALAPVLLADQVVDWSFVNDLPTAIAYTLRPGARALIVRPRGGLEVWAALQSGVSAIVAVEPNPLVVRAVNATSGRSPYVDPRVVVITEEVRTFLRRRPGTFDLIVLALSEPYRPVTSGAYSLGETYDLTVEAFRDYLMHLTPRGILVVTRWLQTPPSECVRAAALAIEGLARVGSTHPADHLVAFRGIQTMTLLVFRVPPTDAEMAAIRAFTESRRFDLVAGPNVRPEEMNRINRLPEPYYERAFAELLRGDRASFYRRYPFAVWPPTDDRPFFFHFFKWAQTPAILRSLGQTWQPFGGSGYFVLIALLILAMLSSLVLLVLPLAAGRWLKARPIAVSSAFANRFSVLLYFGGLGLGFLLVEIPLLQRFILFLGHPTLALAAVLSGLLLCSGLGSLLAQRVRFISALSGLILVIMIWPVVLDLAMEELLGWPLWARLGATAVLLAPIGVLMGIPFPAGLARMEAVMPGVTGWAWAVNGCLSVISAVLAALLALDWGFHGVLWLGAASYTLALGVALYWSARREGGVSQGGVATG
jgi:MFS family permease